jgi:hypothetical protein
MSMSTYFDLVDNADEYGTFPNWIMTGDETWCFLYDPQLKQQISHLEIGVIAKKEESTTGYPCRSLHLSKSSLQNNRPLFFTPSILS